MTYIHDHYQSMFIRAAVHYCGPMRIMKDESDHGEIQCIDMKRSYATFKSARFYEQCQFPNKITHRVQSCDAIMDPGMYRVTDIDFNCASQKWSELCTMRGNPFRNG